VDELVYDGACLEHATALARQTLEMSAVTVRMVKEAINATANALHRVSAYADADQSQLSGAFNESLAARGAFAQRNKN
jgi:enoyl-CoA hydratase